MSLHDEKNDAAPPNAERAEGSPVERRLQDVARAGGPCDPGVKCMGEAPMPRDGDAASKVLFAAIDVFSRVGGIQRFNQRVLRCLQDLHHQGDLSYAVVTVRDERCPAGQRPENFFGARGSKLRTLARSCRQLLLGGPDILLLGHVMLTPLAAVAKALVPGIETVLLVHGYEVWDDPQFGRVSRRDKWCVRHRVDRIVSVSRFTAGRMEQAFGLTGKRFELLPNAVDPLAAVAVPGGPVPSLTSGASERPRRLLTVARLDELGKGVGGVIRALPGIIAAVGPVEYVVVGDGAKRPELEALAQGCGVAGAVRFAGRVTDDELPRCYAESDAFVMPSQKEGFGIVYLEAWQHGLPVVAGNRDAGGEVVDDGVNGLVVDPTSTPQIVDAVVRLLRSPEHARALGAAGREKVLRECGHDPFQRRLQRILRRGGGADGPASDAGAAAPDRADDLTSDAGAAAPDRAGGDVLPNRVAPGAKWTRPEPSELT